MRRDDCSARRRRAWWPLPLTWATPIPVISRNSSAGKRGFPQAITVGSGDAGSGGGQFVSTQRRQGTARPSRNQNEYGKDFLRLHKKSLQKCAKLGYSTAKGRRFPSTWRPQPPIPNSAFVDVVRADVHGNNPIALNVKRGPQVTFDIHCMDGASVNR
jgi:hypothetical protein